MSIDELKKELLEQQALPRLTEMQYSVLKGLIEHLRKTREFPTMKELGEALGVSSARVQQICSVLIKKGCLTSNGKVRGLALTELGVEYYGVKETQGKQLDLLAEERP